MATPTFRAAGTAVFSANNVANPTALSPTAPAGRVVGDLLVCVTESRSRTATVATPSGWNLVSGFPKASATASGGKIYAFTRVADGTASDNASISWSGVTTGTNGDSCGARILAWQNALETADGTPPAATDAAATTSFNIPAHTTGSPNSLVIGVGMRVNDTAHTFTVATFTERSDDHTTTGTGHGTIVAEKVQTTAGSTGTGAVTPSNTTSSRVLAVSFGVRADATRVTLTPTTGSNTAQALSFTKTIYKSLTPTTEAGAAQALSYSKPLAKTVTATTETDTAQAVTFEQASGQNVTLTPTTETDTAQALNIDKTKTLTASTSVETAQALSVTKPIHKSITAATEAGSAQAVTAQKRTVIGQASETESARPLTFAKSKSLTSTTETSGALTLAPVKLAALVAAAEADSARALSLSAPQTVSLTPTTETNTAQTLVPSLVGTPYVIEVRGNYDQIEEVAAAQPSASSRGSYDPQEDLRGTNG